MNVKVNETKTITATSRTVSGMTVRTVIYNTAVATTNKNNDFLPEKVQIRITLNHAGKAIQIYNDNLRIIAMDSSLGSGLFQYLSPSNATGFPIVLLAQGGAVKEISLLPIVIDFGTVINLTGDDYLEAEIVSNGNEYSANVDTSLTAMQVDWIEANGVGNAIPIVDVQSVNPNEGSDDYDCGNGVSRVSFINTDKSGQLTANQVISTNQVSSDRFRASDNYLEAFTKSITGLSEDEISRIDQSLFLVRMAKGEVTHNCKVTLSFNSSNVNGGKNFVVKRRMLSSPSIFAQAEKMKVQRSVQNINLLTNGAISVSTASAMVKR